MSHLHTSAYRHKGAPLHRKKVRMADYTKYPIGDMMDQEEYALSESAIARGKLIDRVVVGGVTILGCIIVICVVTYVVVDKMNQPPYTVLTLMPNPDENHIIRFSPSENETFIRYTTRMAEYIEHYVIKQSIDRHAINCSAGRCPTGKKVCLFDFEHFSPGCSQGNHFGYPVRKPCVLLLLKPPHDWDPENFNQSTVPDMLGTRWSPQHVALHCQGQTTEDQHNMGPIEYLPPEGFPIAYFPYYKKPTFRPPLVMLRFTSPTTDIPIRVLCRILARDIEHDGEMYELNFELHIDENNGETEGMPSEVHYASHYASPSSTAFTPTVDNTNMDYENVTDTSTQDSLFANVTTNQTGAT